MRIATLALCGAVASSCAVSRAPEATHTQIDALPALPEPPPADHEASQGACDSHTSWSSQSPTLRVNAADRTQPPNEFSGVVETTEEVDVDPLGRTQHDSRTHYRRVKITTDRGAYNLDSVDVRALDFPPGMPVQVALRDDVRGPWGQADHRVTVRSGDALLVDYIFVASVDTYELESGLVLEQADELCGQEGLCGGYVHALRVTDATGASVVIEPGLDQARSLGDFDIYVWLALFRPQGPLGGGQDCPRGGSIEITFVNRRHR